MDTPWKDSKQKYFLFPLRLSPFFLHLLLLLPLFWLQSVKFRHNTNQNKQSNWLHYHKVLSYLFCNLNIPLTEKFEVLTAVVMKSTIFWDITPCSPLKVGRHFGETYCLHLQSRISWAKYQHDSRRQAGWYLARLIRPWRWTRYVPPRCMLAFNRLHGVIFQKIVLFISLIIEMILSTIILRYVT
jgi:hypothetical protein